MTPPHLRIPREQLEAAYNDRVVRRGSECWDWAGSKNNHGYGVICQQTGNVFAHRASFFLYVGEITQSDVLHLCHNPVCSNPEHLRQGTRRDNMRTSLNAGRLWRVVPLEAIPSIEARRTAGETFVDIAKDFGCSAPAIRALVRSHDLDDSKGRRSDPDTLITYRGETLPLRAWARRLNIPHATLRYRYVRSGWSAERSLTEPLIRGPKAARKRLMP